MQWCYPFVCLFWSLRCSFICSFLCHLKCTLLLHVVHAAAVLRNRPHRCCAPASFSSMWKTFHCEIFASNRLSGNLHVASIYVPHLFKDNRGELIQRWVDVGFIKSRHLLTSLSVWLFFIYLLRYLQTVILSLFKCRFLIFTVRPPG